MNQQEGGGYMESSIKNQYQIIVLKSPYHLMGIESVEKTFINICKFKIDGYLREYPSGVLPLDTSDFIANHIILCEKGTDSFEPIMGFKSITLQTCDNHRIPFPMIGMLKSIDDTSAHLSYFETLLNKYRLENKAHSIAYNGSFTVHARKRSDPNFHKILWDMVSFLLASYYISEKIENVVAVAATKYKVDHRKTERGWDYIEHNSKRLGSYRANSLFDAELIPMQIQGLDIKCQKDKERYKFLWDQRIVYENQIPAKKVA
jgi:hypothetical protein